MITAKERKRRSGAATAKIGQSEKSLWERMKSAVSGASESVSAWNQRRKKKAEQRQASLKEKMKAFIHPIDTLKEATSGVAEGASKFLLYGAIFLFVGLLVFVYVKKQIDA